jgi:hypothetical protein
MKLIKVKIYLSFKCKQICLKNINYGLTRPIKNLFPDHEPLPEEKS